MAEDGHRGHRPPQGIHQQHLHLHRRQLQHQPVEPARDALPEHAHTLTTHRRAVGCCSAFLHDHTATLDDGLSETSFGELICPSAVVVSRCMTSSAVPPGS